MATGAHQWVILTVNCSLKQGYSGSTICYPPVPGLASAVAVLFFLCGTLFILLGMLGEYIGRSLLELRGRARYLMQEELGSFSADSRF